MIRLWDTENGSKVQELRRGKDPANIYFLSFDPLSKYLSVSSDKGTIHIFAVRSDLAMSAAQNRAIDDANGHSQSEDKPAVGEHLAVSNTKSMFSLFGGVISYLGSEWSFA